MTTGALAIIAGAGGLPGLVAQACPDAHLVRIKGAGCTLASDKVIEARFEQMGALFEAMHSAGVTDVVFAGAMQRPPLDPALLDAVTLAAAPRIMAAMQGGDDGLLRAVIDLFEENGFDVVGVHTLVPNLVVDTGTLCGDPGTDLLADAARGTQILTTLGPLDVGQGCVVAGGLCFGIETLQGTDALLRFVGDSRAGHRPERGGVLVKRAKPGQDLRVDMPTIGPDTVDAAATAGLTGIAIQASHVLVLDRPQLIARADAAGIAVWAAP